MISQLPAQLKVEALDAQHCEYSACAQTLEDIELLYCGGHRIEAEAKRFLRKRPKEQSDVYTARLERFSYQNILGTAIGWYQSALFETDPEVRVKSESGDADAPQAEQDWYAGWMADCDRGGTTYVDFWRTIGTDLMKFRTGYVLVDLPAHDATEYATREAQRVSGALDPYLVRFDQRQAINWDCDQYGNLDWIVFASSVEVREIGQKPIMRDRWYLFDREAFAVYEADRKEGTRRKAEIATQVMAGRHALADQKRVPVRRVEVEEGIWLAGRAWLQCLDHLNADNAYAWALFMSCLPIPIIKGDFAGGEASETAYLQLAIDGDFSYAEPAGTAYTAASGRVASLREEIYRQMYLQSQAKDAAATASAQSGYSKEMDMAPSRAVLSAFGDVLRAGIKGVLDDVALIRSSAVTFDVRGFDFEDDSTVQEIDSDQKAIDLGVPSLKWKKEIWKRAARRQLKDADEAVLVEIDREIDAAEDPEEVEARRLEERMKGAFAGAPAA